VRVRVYKKMIKILRFNEKVREVEGRINSESLKYLIFNEKVREKRLNR